MRLRHFDPASAHAFGGTCPVKVLPMAMNHGGACRASANDLVMIEIFMFTSDSSGRSLFVD